MTHPSASPNTIQRRITLLRHAKALPDTQGDDHARALAPAGLTAAQALAVWLRASRRLPQLALCSTAVRTRETLAALAGLLPTQLHASLYLAHPHEMLALLQQTDNAVQHVMLVGHNPGIHALAVSLVAQHVDGIHADALDHGFPTCGLVSMRVPITTWRMLAPQSATLDTVHFTDSAD